MNEIVRSKVTVLAALMIGYAIIGLAIGAFVFMILTGIAFGSGDPDALFVLSLIGTAVALLFALGALPSLISGIALLKGWTWSRVITLVASAINIFSFPFGTAIAIYAIIVLSNPEVAWYLDSGGKPDPRTAAPPADPLDHDDSRPDSAVAS